MHRRALLAASGTALASMAGCLNAEQVDTENDDESASAESNGTAPANESATDTRAQSDSTTEDGDDETTTPAVHSEYDTTTVRVFDSTGVERGAVTAAIADTSELRYLGLSDTESLPADRGMLFVFDGVADRTFVMRRMDFGIDIVYADSEGTITGIHHAPKPGPDEDGNSQGYPGTGQYVLEVNYEWTTERGISEGDRLAFDLEG